MKIKLFICLGILLSFHLDAQQVRDDIVDRKIMADRGGLPYGQLREADILWEKRVWRVIDVREKMNLPFMYPEAPFFSLLQNWASNGEITLYTVEDDQFTYPIDEVDPIFYNRDTIIQFDPVTYEEKIIVVDNRMNMEDVKRFRIKEVWFFDEQTSSMKVRILGIAPLKDVENDHGDFLYEQPLFWVYYPELRDLLAKEKVFNPGNDAALTSWEDLFESRYFASTIYKESNVYDRRLKDYLSGVDLLLEADKISQEIFNFEHDLWSY